MQDVLGGQGNQCLMEQSRTAGRLKQAHLHIEQTSCLQFAEMLEGLDPERKCKTYWEGKAARDEQIAAEEGCRRAISPKGTQGAWRQEEART